MIDLDSYLIAEEELSAFSGALIGTAAVIGAAGIASQIRRRNDKRKARKFEQAKQRNQFNNFFDTEEYDIARRFEEFNYELISTNDHEWVREKQARIAAVKDIRKKLIQLNPTFEKLSEGTISAKYAIDAIDKYLADARIPKSYSSYDEWTHDSHLDDFSFLTNPLPSVSKEKGLSNYTFDYWDFSINIYFYDIWEWIKKHPDKNARDMEQSRPYYEVDQRILDIAIDTFKPTDFIRKVDCGGDWDNGSVELILKPSTSFLNSMKSRLNLGKKWPKLSDI